MPCWLLGVVDGVVFTGEVLTGGLTVLWLADDVVMSVNAVPVLGLYSLLPELAIAGWLTPAILTLMSASEITSKCRCEVIARTKCFIATIVLLTSLLFKEAVTLADQQ